MLHELIRYAKTTGMESEPGFRSKWVRWLIVFDAKGQLLQIDDLTFGEKKSKGREFEKAPDLHPSQMVSNGLRHFLVDNLDKVVLLTKDEPNDRDHLQHDRYVTLLDQAANDVPALKTIAKSLQDESVLTSIRTELKDRKAKPTDTATVAMYEDGEQTIFVDQDVWHSWWRQFLQSLGASKVDSEATETKTSKRPKKGSEKSTMRCFLSGDLVEPTATWNKISGLTDVGGLQMGDVISSFDKEAFCHYGFEQGENAAVGETQVKSMADAFNRLLQKSVRLGNSKVLYWYSQSIDVDPIEDLFGGAIEAAPDESDEGAMIQERSAAELSAKKLLQAIESGEREELKKCKFFIMIVSANKGRVVIEHQEETDLKDLCQSIARWFDDLFLNNITDSKANRPPKLMQLLSSVLRPRSIGQNFDNWFAPVRRLRRELWKCASTIHRIPIPLGLVELAVLRQVNAGTIGELPLNRTRESAKADNPALALSSWYARLSVMKAYLNRKLTENNEANPKMLPSLNENHPSKAYQLGRLMAVLQMIQEKVSPDVGTTISQSFYAAASTRPITVFSRMLNLVQHHLSKIKSDELRKEFNRMLVEIQGAIQNDYPGSLNLDDQCMFHLGFYQQWAYQPHDKPAHRHTTLSGVKVRSKGEVLIANLLTFKGLKYDYEPELVLSSGRTIRPDFRVLTKNENIPIYIEHLGMMDNFRYREDWDERKKLYIENGIVQLTESNINKKGFFTTTEDGSGFDSNEILRTLGPVLERCC